MNLRKFILAVGLLVLAGDARGASRSVEELKTVYIERFTRFIEWPSNALPAAAPAATVAPAVPALAAAS